MPKEQTPLSLWLHVIIATAAWNFQDFMQCLNQQKANHKFYHDSNSVRDLQPNQVRIAPCLGSRLWNPAIVFRDHDSPCFYIVQSDRHKCYHNRRLLRWSTEAANTTTQCLDLAADDNTLHLDNVLSSTPSMELCNHSSSQQQESATNSSVETSQPDELYTIWSGCTVCCPESLDLESRKLILL